jgi:uncharacterized membrane protein
MNITSDKSLRGGTLIGIGMMAAVDEILFHQILGWHHFYDLSTPRIGLLTDGILHSAELLAIVSGCFLLIELVKKGALSPRAARAGFFIGAGGFQMFDGIIDHKVLRLHQIRYGVDLLPYDLTWNLSGALLLLIGVFLIRKGEEAK